MQFHKKDLFTIPNIMTYFRILLVPAFIVFYFRSSTIKGYICSISIIALSALTDVLDGIVARKTNQVTDLGKILDPIADKAMQFAMMFCVVFRYHLVAILIVIYAVKEIISLCFSSYLLAHNKNINGAMWCGKVCTVILYSVMFLLVVHPNIKHPIDTIMICISGAFMILAFVIYMSVYIKLLAELKSESTKS